MVGVLQCNKMILSKVCTREETDQLTAEVQLKPNITTESVLDCTGRIKTNKKKLVVF
jgi:hypothetical protein